MQSYVIVTDSGSDLSKEELAGMDMDSADLTFSFEDIHEEFTNSTMPIEEFYSRMKNGMMAKTAAVSPDRFRMLFSKYLSNSLDILYIGLSSGLSSTFHNAVLAAEDLKKRFSDRKVVLLDSLTASLGEGMIAEKAGILKKVGASLKETYDRSMELVKSLRSILAVSDLSYVRRGERISSLKALAGELMHIKPLMKVDEKGQIRYHSRAHSMKKIFGMMIDDYEEHALSCDGPLYLSYSSEEYALEMTSLLKRKLGREFDRTGWIGPVIGCHSGPGGVAMFYPSKEF